MKVELVAFTARGAALCAELCRALGPRGSGSAPARFCTGGLQPLAAGVGRWTSERFLPGRALVFIGAAGIAVRAIAPHVHSKQSDPAVLCIDEHGRHVIPLLSGHLGGANRLARELAQLSGGEAVLTTATDLNGVFSPDAWAAENGCAVADAGKIKHVSAALLAGEPVGLRSAFPIGSALPPGVGAAKAACGIELAFVCAEPWPHTLHLIPRCIVAGIGCRRGVPGDAIERRLHAVLAQNGLPVQAVGAVASIDRKAEEPGLRELCDRLWVPLLTFSAQELMAAEGEFTASERVLRVTGADNVCERAAVRAGGVLFAPKSCGEGVTVALARREWTACFV